MTDTPSTSVTDLARLIDEALALLAVRDTGEDLPDAAETAPLPSLLAQCERLLDTATEDAARLRYIHSFGALDASARHALNAFPNLTLLDAPPLVVPAAASGQMYGQISDRVSEGDQRLARQAALRSLLDSQSQRGRHLAVVIDDLHGHSGLNAQDPEDPANRPDAIAVLVAGHPLRSYLRARRHGTLPFRPVTLELYATRYLAFLERHAGLPRFTPEELTGNPGDVPGDPPGTAAPGAGPDAAPGAAPGAALAALGAALHLPVPAGEPRPVAGMAPDMAPDMTGDMTDTAGTSVLFFRDGSIATEEPLDSPAYLKLCRILGYDPGTLARPPEDGPRGTPPFPAALPARRQDRSPSRVTGVLPRLARILQTRAPTGDLAGFQLDTHALIATLEECLGHPDGMPEALDRCLAQLQPRDGALLQIACAAHFQACGQPIHALSLLAEADIFVHPGDRPLRLLMAELHLKMGKHDLAIAALSADAFAGPGALEPASQTKLRAFLTRLSPKTTDEHGHALLLSRLGAAPPRPDSGRRIMIEIGTTRETVPGQGSTEKLAACCVALGIDFITVDMDPRNTAMAQRMFRRRGYPFRAVTARGEDFLAGWSERIDYCFLDAYDFDHGMHSELRQSRYESFLGSRIDEAACHQMHLDCAQSLIRKLSPDGLICFDDTWTNADGNWTAKGTTAMPLLLDSGFKVIEARNRAALLARA